MDIFGGSCCLLQWWYFLGWERPYRTWDEVLALEGLYNPEEKDMKNIIYSKKSPVIVCVGYYRSPEDFLYLTWPAVIPSYAACSLISFIKILQIESIYTKWCHVIWFLIVQKNQAVAIAQYLGPCLLIRKCFKPSPQSKRNCFLLMMNEG